MTRTRLILLATALAACAWPGLQAVAQDRTAPTAKPAASRPQVGDVEIVATLDITPGNVTASRDGRIFMSVHGFRRGPVQLVEITGPTTWRAFPNDAWNARPGSGPDVLNTPHGVVIDSKDRLWVIDHGNWLPTPQSPKLVAFDIKTGRVAYRLNLGAAVAPPGQILQDLAVDGERGFVYLADCGPDPALVVVDTNTGRSRRFAGHPSLRAEDVELIVEGERKLFPGPGGKMAPARVGVNPITLSADGERVFFGAMNGTTWYGVPARLLRNGASDAEIGRAIRAVGPKPVSDGAATDAEGNHFITNLAENGIDVLTSKGQLRPLVRDTRFTWPDNAHFGPASWLYVAVNQLHRAAIFTGQADTGRPPYYIARVWTGTRGQPGR